MDIDKETIEKAIIKVLKINNLNHEVDNLNKIMGFASEEIMNDKNVSLGCKVEAILNTYLKRPEKIREELGHINKIHNNLKTEEDLTDIMRKIPQSILMDTNKTHKEIAEYIWSSITIMPFSNSTLSFKCDKKSEEHFDPTSTLQDAYDAESEKAYYESLNIEELNKMSDKEKMALIYFAYSKLPEDKKTETKLAIDCIKDFIQ